MAVCLFVDSGYSLYLADTAIIISKANMYLEDHAISSSKVVLYLAYTAINSNTGLSDGRDNSCSLHTIHKRCEANFCGLDWADGLVDGLEVDCRLEEDCVLKDERMVFH